MANSPPSPTVATPPPPSGGVSSDEIAFFDVETTVPSRAGQGHCLLEFGAILVCKRKLVEVGCYSTLIRPSDLSLISATSIRCNGITREAVADAPTFAEVADGVYNILHGRVWAGHNILRFDCARIREAFAEIGRPAPEPKGTIDSLPLLTQKFGKRAGNMKMATLAAYFGLGQQRHRSLDDIRMNLEVLKYCATVLFLESSALELARNNITSSAALRTDSDMEEYPVLGLLASPSLNNMSDLRLNDQNIETLREDITKFSSSNIEESNNLVTDMDASSLEPLIEETRLSPDQTVGVTKMPACSSTCTEFLDPERVLKSHLSTSLLSVNRHGCRMVLLHKEVPLQFHCMELRVHFGISTRFLDHVGQPKLSIALDVSESLCQVLDTCETVARRSLADFGSNSDWKPLIKRDNFSGSAFVRLNLPTSVDEDAITCLVEVYQKEPCGNMQRLDLSKSTVAELKSLFVPGTMLETYFGVDVYDYQQNAGIRLVAKQLVLLPKNAESSSQAAIKTTDEIVLLPIIIHY